MRRPEAGLAAGSVAGPEGEPPAGPSRREPGYDRLVQRSPAGHLESVGWSDCVAVAIGLLYALGAGIVLLVVLCVATSGVATLRDALVRRRQNPGLDSWAQFEKDLAEYSGEAFTCAREAEVRELRR